MLTHDAVAQIANEVLSRSRIGNLPPDVRKQLVVPLTVGLGRG